jgi:hypothetical protein
METIRTNEMLNELRQNAVVQTGGVVSIQSPDLSAGTAVEVIILIEPQKNSATEQTLTQLIGAAKGNFATPEAVDQFIRQERDTWDS